MFRRQRSGSVLCTSCGVLVGVNDETCYNCGRRNPGLWGFAPALRSLGHDMGFVPFVIGTCVVLYGAGLVVTLLRGESITGGGLLGLFGPSLPANFLLGASGAVPIVAYGRWWTVLSASWLHAGALHILFNMSVVRQMAPATADVYGPGRTVIIYVVGGAAGFALSSFAGAYIPPFPLLAGSPYTVGASASIAAMIGAIMYFGRRGGSGMARSYASRYVVMLVIVGLMAGVDNYAHAGGFAGGYVVARILDPLKRERIDHIAIAVGLLALSLLSVVVSIVLGLRFLP